MALQGIINSGVVCFKLIMLSTIRTGVRKLVFWSHATSPQVKHLHLDSYNLPGPQGHATSPPRAKGARRTHRARQSLLGAQGGLVWPGAGGLVLVMVLVLETWWC